MEENEKREVDLIFATQRYPLGGIFTSDFVNEEGLHKLLKECDEYKQENCDVVFIVDFKKGKAHHFLYEKRMAEIKSPK